MVQTEKKRILVFTDWYLPGYRAGGPIRSLANMVNALKHDFFIVTRITDHHSTEPYKNISPNTWIKTSDNVQVFYFEESSISGEAMRSIIKDLQCDKIYFNSLFSPKFTLLPLRIARKMKLVHKCVLAPRGMLKPGALSIKARKKKIFLLVTRLMGLFSGITWHATSEEEANEIRSKFPAQDIRMAPNLSGIPSERINKPAKQKGELKLICIARISPEKGIMEALNFLKSSGLKGEVSCDFFGTQQNPAYLEECRDFAETIPGIKIRFRGEILPADIPPTLKNYHFFYMATLGENFGHAISEALINATPVIISDRTPWRNLAARKAGWDLALNPGEFVPVLKQCMEMENTHYASLSEGAYLYGCQVALDHSILEASYKIFQ